MTATKDQVAQIIVGEAKARNHTRDECLAEMSALYQESGWDETIWDPTHTTYGVAQQDGSYPNRFQGAAAQVKAFFDKLDVKRASPGHGDIWLNICWLQQAPNWPSAQYWWDHGRQAYLTEIKSRIPTVTPYLDKYWPAGGTPVTTPAQDLRLTALQKVRPDFNEYPNWSDNSQDRPGNPSDVVDLWLNHTEEGDMNADALVTWMKDNGVSYHYAGSQDPNDGGVTVVDMIDTDLASWSVMNSNGRSINFCYAGSYSSWTRDEWMSKAGKVIDVAAYLAVQDAIKYPKLAPARVIVPYADPPGIADHRYCSVYLKDGNNHSDVGGPLQPPWTGFPWDYFTERVAFYWAAANNAADDEAGQPTPPPPAAAKIPTGDAALRLLMEQQLGPWDDAAGRFTGWPQLAGDPDALKVLQGKVDAGIPLSQVDAIAATRFNITPSETPKAVCAPAPKKKTASKKPAKKAPAKASARKSAR
ncbi:N-acetylmuramoyl-L-alanine amidase [Mycobacterium intracellulare]|uniref:N-acetylmuramoyl-L-alanine amidase n=1 Tax=Mycobacterium intracellulare TaxID=1767 RepID=UPI001B34E25E|nr:N-acetylmuramoyl-L-alanine amidase [Mycobacterium intracellulare]